MRIGILQTGRSPEEIADIHGDYDAFFKRLLKDRGFDFRTYAVLDMDLPADAHECDGWLITGSRHGAYEDHPWIPPLEDFLRAAYAAAVPIIGVCFGHQILAQALGGRVEKFAGGWSVGPVRYRSDRFGDHDIIAFHQDQVVELPPDAERVGSSDFCENAILVYGDRALSIQPHPEFTAPFLKELIDARAAILPDEIRDRALSKADTPLTSDRFADEMERFFKAAR
ncbi:type 1 glutamine amidotransferase [Jannaschia aquimarina]|uniref:GuaA_2 protein n=1 Tax=Jannaschia aquimarina TaxID=935700 RepID=A0A0D1CKC0_9RHOB|nr:type 1 glutamine amidotransferase [Jannaschia aquimarina]KIT15192.1 GMP synthase [Jannaschia aquimarina]SNS85529.1 GMP synthase (glutamine-hydrolysing) [Jannaschia aquimarina]